MVSNFRYRNLKRLSLKSRHPFTYLVMAVFILIGVASEPGLFLFPLACAYAAHGPLESILITPRREKKLAEQSRMTGATTTADDEDTTQHDTRPSLQ